MASDLQPGAIGGALGSKQRALDLPPPAALALLYAVLIGLGTVLLKLPVAAPQPITWSDALFTATSAVTVTGLIVVDPGSELTVFGQAVVALLIQLGGLGLMSFAAVFLTSLGLPIPIPQKLFLQQDLGQTPVGQLLALVLTIFRVSIVLTLIGWALLALVFVPEFGWGWGLWQALFHAISAFNNAGFSLFSNSLVDYVGSPLINITVTALFIVGGLGFVVVYEALRKRAWRAFSLHTKLMIAGTAGLIAISVPLFAVLEWHNPATLGGLDSIGDKLWASWFQAVTPRTAGFNTIDTAGYYDATSLLTVVLMIIGGGPTSTAGGVKVTTFLVIFLATVAFFKRQERINAFGYALGFEQVLKVMALMTISGGLIILSLFVLILTEDQDFMVLVFEVSSAFGTVGLSQGATGELDTPGRLLICLLMFAGRVGPLTFGFFLATKTAPRIRYPDGQIFLG